MTNKLCTNCGDFYNGEENNHSCPIVKDIPTHTRRPSNYGNIMWCLLTRQDKEQLDRIESKLDQLLKL